MANTYYVDLMVSGRIDDLDELEIILKHEIDHGQTEEDYYTFHHSIEEMGFDPKTVDDRRAYTEDIDRIHDCLLNVHYCGAWSFCPGVLRCIHKKWPNLTLEWEGVDEFGQDPRTNKKKLEGKYQLEDEDTGLEPFDELDYDWMGEEAVPAINAYYHTNVKTVEEAIDTIDGLCASMPMVYLSDDEIYTEEEMEKIA